MVDTQKLKKLRRLDNKLRGEENERKSALERGGKNGKGNFGKKNYNQGNKTNNTEPIPGNDVQH